SRRGARKRLPPPRREAGGSERSHPHRRIARRPLIRAAPIAPQAGDRNASVVIAPVFLFRDERVAAAANLRFARSFRGGAPPFVSAHGERREQAFHVSPLTRRAQNARFGRTHERLELVSAGAASKIVERHVRNGSAR